MGWDVYIQVQHSKQHWAVVWCGTCIFRYNVANSTGQWDGVGRVYSGTTQQTALGSGMGWDVYIQVQRSKQHWAVVWGGTCIFRYNAANSTGQWGGVEQQKPKAKRINERKKEKINVYMIHVPNILFLYCNTTDVYFTCKDNT